MSSSLDNTCSAYDTKVLERNGSTNQLQRGLHLGYASQDKMKNRVAAEGASGEQIYEQSVAGSAV